jgi:hypothetical protein
MGNGASNSVAMGLLMLSVMAVLPSVRAEDAKPSPPPQQPEKTQLLQGPTLRETGRIAPMLVKSNGVEIQKRSDLVAPKENSIQSASAEERPLPQPRAGVIDHAVLDRQIKARFSNARECRMEIGRRKQLPPSHVSAGTLTLRWTILTSGEVAATVVVANSPTDSDLIDCVKRHMAAWTFTRPRGGAVSVERTLSFR